MGTGPLGALVSPVIAVIREEEFVTLGLCADGSVRLTCKGVRSLQLSTQSPTYTAVSRLAEIVDPDDFESAAMGYLYAR